METTPAEQVKGKAREENIRRTALKQLALVEVKRMTVKTRTAIATTAKQRGHSSGFSISCKASVAVLSVW